MQLFLSFLLILLLLLSNPIHGHKTTTKIVTEQRRILAVKAVAPAPAASNATLAPAPESSNTTSTVDLISLMSKKGCKTFASLLSAGAGDVAKTFTDAVSGGLTVFCPTDGAMKAFMPKFKNLTADSKVSLLLYHGVPVYNNMDSLKTNNGVVNTLATDGTARDYNFTVQNDGTSVTLQTDVTTANIESTILDKDPLAIYSIDTVLEPRELFKPPPGAPAPAPAVAPAADAPAAGKKGKGKKKHEAPAPAGPDAAPADQKAADENGAGRGRMRIWVTAAAVMGMVMVVVA